MRGAGGVWAAGIGLGRSTQVVSKGAQSHGVAIQGNTATHVHSHAAAAARTAAAALSVRIVHTGHRAATAAYARTAVAAAAGAAPGEAVRPHHCLGDVQGRQEVKK